MGTYFDDKESSQHVSVPCTYYLRGYLNDPPVLSVTLSTGVELPTLMVQVPLLSLDTHTCASYTLQNIPSGIEHLHKGVTRPQIFGKGP